MKDKRARFVTMTCCDLSDTLDLIYSFDVEGELINIRAHAEKDRAWPSICPVFSCAFLVENEIKEQFRLEFEGLSPDFQGHMFLSEEIPPGPMLKKTPEGGREKDV